MKGHMLKRSRYQFVRILMLEQPMHQRQFWLAVAATAQYWFITSDLTLFQHLQMSKNTLTSFIDHDQDHNATRPAISTHLDTLPKQDQGFATHATKWATPG